MAVSKILAVKQPLSHWYGMGGPVMARPSRLHRCMSALSSGCPRPWPLASLYLGVPQPLSQTGIKKISDQAHRIASPVPPAGAGWLTAYEHGEARPTYSPGRTGLTVCRERCCIPWATRHSGDPCSIRIGVSGAVTHPATAIMSLIKRSRKGRNYVGQCDLQVQLSG